MEREFYFFFKLFKEKESYLSWGGDREFNFRDLVKRRERERYSRRGKMRKLWVEKRRECEREGFFFDGKVGLEF